MDYFSASHELKQNPLADAPPWVLQNVQEYRSGLCLVVDCHEQRSSDSCCAKHEQMHNGEQLELRMQQLGVLNSKRRIRRHY
jgi:hypothetical protein